MLIFEVGPIDILGIATVIIFGFIFFLLTELRMLRKEIRAKQPATAGNSLLPLQAYERLSLLADRIMLKNLITRMHADIFSAQELQAGLVETIRKEYEHNITQQIYINPDVWKAITKMKEQNIFIINQIAEGLPPGASAIDLSNLILEYSSNNNAELGLIVLDAIQYEVKKLV